MQAASDLDTGTNISRYAALELAAGRPGFRTLGSTANVESAAGAAALARAFERFPLSANSIHVGAWSLAFSQPRTWRSTAAVLRRGAIDGLSSR